MATFRKQLNLTGCYLGKLLLDYSPDYDARLRKEYWLPPKGQVHIALNKSISGVLYTGIEQDVTIKLIDGLEVLKCYFVPDKGGVAELKVTNTQCNYRLLHQGMMLFKE